MIVYEKMIASTFQAVSDTVHDIVDVLKQNNYDLDQHALFRISFMLREIMNNAVEHGNGFDQEKEVSCRVYFEPPDIKFEVQDQGSGISPHVLLKPHALQIGDVDEDLLRERTRGYQTILDMAFEIELDGNCVTITYRMHAS